MLPQKRQRTESDRSDQYEKNDNIRTVAVAETDSICRTVFIVM